MNTAHPDFDTLKKVESHEKAVVIGSGFGGLASAIRLAAKGYHVTLLKSLMRWEVEATPINRMALPSMADPPLLPYPSYLKSSGHCATRK